MGRMECKKSAGQPRRSQRNWTVDILSSLGKQIVPEPPRIWKHYIMMEPGIVLLLKRGQSTKNFRLQFAATKIWTKSECEALATANVIFVFHSFHVKRQNFLSWNGALCLKCELWTETAINLKKVSVLYNFYCHWLIIDQCFQFLIESY